MLLALLVLHESTHRLADVLDRKRLAMIVIVLRDEVHHDRFAKRRMARFDHARIAALASGFVVLV